MMRERGRRGMHEEPHFAVKPLLSQFGQEVIHPKPNSHLKIRGKSSLTTKNTTVTHRKGTTTGANCRSFAIWRIWWPLKWPMDHDEWRGAAHGLKDAALAFLPILSYLNLASFCCPSFECEVVKE